MTVMNIIPTKGEQKMIYWTLKEMGLCTKCGGRITKVIRGGAPEKPKLKLPDKCECDKKKRRK